MDGPADNDLLLVLVRSLLDGPLSASLSEAAILNALADADGSVERAAEALRRGGSGQGSRVPQAIAATARPAGGTLARKRVRGSMTVAGWLEVESPPAKVGRPSRPPTAILTTAPSALDRLMAAAPLPSAPVKPVSSLPPLLLATPSLLAQYLPCVAVPPSPLPPRLASALFSELMEDSKGWTFNQYVIGGRTVESAHTTVMYQSAVDPPYPPGELDESARFWNNNVECPTPPLYSPLLQEAALLVEDAVNDTLAARPDARKFAGEYQGRWRAGVAGINRYDGAASGVGLHADQLTYLGPYCTIVSLSLGTSRKFRLRQVRSKDPAVRLLEGEPRTFDVPLVHNTLLCMIPPCQERFQHSIPTQKSVDVFRPTYDASQTFVPPERRKSYTSRIAITFRFYRPDFAPGGSKEARREGTPRCSCKLPCMLKADQRSTVSLSLRSGLSAPGSPAKGVGSGPSPESFVFYWTCTKRAGWAGLDADAEGAKKPGDGSVKREGCGFFRVLDLRKEGRDCGVPLEAPPQPADLLEAVGHAR